MKHHSFRGNESWKNQACQRLNPEETSDSKSAAARRASSSLAAGTIGKTDVSDHSRPQNFRTVSATPAASGEPDETHPQYVLGWKAGYKHGAWQGQHCAQPAASGERPRWVCLEDMNPDELAAYDYGCAGANDAILSILDGKDTGAGVANEPWEGIRRRLLALVQKPAASGEPVAVIERDGVLWLNTNPNRMPIGTRIYATAQPAPARVPDSCPTYETTSGNTVICQRCGDCWNWGAERACVRAAKLLARAGTPEKDAP